MFAIPALTLTEVGILDRDGKGHEVEETETLNSRTKLTEVEKAGETLDRSKKIVEMDKPRQKVEKEEKEGMLVAGLHLQQEHRDKFSAHGQESEEDKGGNEELEVENIKNAKHELAEQGRGDRTVDSNLTPPLSTTQQGEQTKFPATKPATANHSLVSTEAPGRGTSFRPIEELTTKVPKSPTHRFRIQNELEGQASPNEPHGTEEANQLKPAGLIPEVQVATPETTLELTTKYSKTREPIQRQKSSKNTMKNVTESAGKSQTSMKNNMELTATRNKPSPTRPLVTKPSVEMQLAAVVSASVKQVKGNKKNGKKNADKLKEKKRKKDNRTQQLAKTEEVAAPTHFPYFLDDYCPPECACYGR